MIEQTASFALGSFSKSGGAHFVGVVQGDAVTRVAELDSARFGPQTTLLDMLEDWGNAFGALRHAVAGDRNECVQLNLADLDVHAPVPGARQIFCTGANFGKHVVEMVVLLGSGTETEGMDEEQRRVFGESYVARQKAEANPYVFMKPITAIAGPYDPLELPAFSDKADWEIELGVVMGAVTQRVARADAMACVAGYMVVNDVTARDKVRRTDPGAIGPDWLSAKGAVGFLPSGPLFVPAAFVPNPHDLAMRLTVNGEMMQDDSTSDMTFDIPTQIEWIASHVKMLPGDILCTGSPSGNGVVRGIFLKEGDVMEAEIEGLGRQSVRCVAGASR